MWRPLFFVSSPFVLLTEVSGQKAEPRHQQISRLCSHRRTTSSRVPGAGGAAAGAHPHRVSGISNPLLVSLTRLGGWDTRPLCWLTAPHGPLCSWSIVCSCHVTASIFFHFRLHCMSDGWSAAMLGCQAPWLFANVGNGDIQRGAGPLTARSSSSVCRQWNGGQWYKSHTPGASRLLGIITGSALYPAAVLNPALSFTFPLRNSTISIINSTTGGCIHSQSTLLRSLHIYSFFSFWLRTKQKSNRAKLKRWFTIFICLFIFWLLCINRITANITFELSTFLTAHFITTSSLLCIPVTTVNLSCLYVLLLLASVSE